jgi:hypothetical protein
MLWESMTAAEEESDAARKALASADAAAGAGRLLEARASYLEAWRHVDRASDLYKEVRDPDRDRLDDPIEARAGTDPKKPDTDGDGVGDGREILELARDPLSRDPPDSDRDSDGATDVEELRRGTDPLK